MTLQRITCQCGKSFMHYGDAVSCPYCFRAVSQPVKQKAAPEPVKASPAKPEKAQKIKRKPKSERQKLAVLKAKERWQVAISGMVNNIRDKIDAGYYTIHDYLADPMVYYDRQIMGSYYGNMFAHKKIYSTIQGLVGVPF